MKLDKLTTEPIVIFRTSGSYADSNTFIAIDISKNGVLESYGRGGTGGSSQSFRPNVDFTTPEGYGIRYSTNNRVEIEKISSCTSSSCYWTFVRESGADTSSTPKSNCEGNEVCTDAISYSADFNFCPPNDPNFLYCQGDKKHVESDQAGLVYFTDEAELLYGESLLFGPTYSDGSAVSERFIRVRGYDCSCLPAIEDGDACSSDQELCIKPCDDGFTLFTSGQVHCYSGGGFNYYNAASLQRPICHQNPNPSIRTWCKESPGHVFKRCDSSQQIGQSTCGDFGITRNCPAGQQCYVDATGQQGDGLGHCACSATECDSNPLGYKVKLSDTTYKECITIGDCLDWSSTRNCPTGLIFNEDTQQCICNPLNVCVPQTAECITSDTIKHCREKLIGGLTCFEWDTTATECVGSSICNDRGTPELDDVCDCTGNYANKCSGVSSIKCDPSDNEKKFECSKKSGDECYTWDSTSVPTNSGKICQNDVEVGKPGCDNADPCTDIDNDGVVDFTCVNNVCIPKTTGDYCTGNENPSCLSETQVKSCNSIGSGVFKWNVELTDDNKKCSGGLEICRTTGDYCVQNAPNKCQDSNNAKNCISDNLGCYIWTPQQCGSDTLCFNGECEQFGCGFGTAGYSCSEIKDDNDIFIEVCPDNTCIIQQDIFTATSNDFVAETTKCYENNVYSVKEYTTTANSHIYRWEKIQTCAGGTPFCFGEDLE